MNILKGIAGFFISIILILLVDAYSLSISLKYVLQNQIIGSVVKEQIINSYVENSKTFKDKDKLEGIINDNKSNEIIDNIIDDYIKYLDDSNYKVSDKTIDSILDFCVKHKDELSEISDHEITEEEIRKSETREDLTKSLNDGFSSLGNNLGQTEKDIIKSYSTFTSKSFRIVLLVLIFVQIVLLVLIKWSPYKWMTPTGVSFIISGVFIGTSYLIAKIILNNVIVNDTKEISINPKIMLILAIVELSVGVILLITKTIIGNTLEKQRTV